MLVQAIETWFHPVKFRVYTSSIALKCLTIIIPLSLSFALLIEVIFAVRKVLNLLLLFNFLLLVLSVVVVTVLLGLL